MSKGMSFNPQDRDHAIMRDAGKCGVVTTAQMNRRYWWQYISVIPTRSDRLQANAQPRIMNHSNCQRRMHLLHEAGYLKRIKYYQLLEDGKRPYAYSLTPLGAQVLEEYGISVEQLGWRKVDNRLRHNYIEHLMRSADVSLAIDLTVEQTPWLELVAWKDDLMIYKEHYDDVITFRYENGAERQERYLPDFYFRIRSSDGKERDAFGEIDLGTETAISDNDLARSWFQRTKKSMVYIAAKTPDGRSLFERRYGAKSARILTITTSERRLERLLDSSEKAGARALYWFTTFQRAVKPIITAERRTVTEDGQVREVEFYSARLPNILHDPIWTVASLDRSVLHTLTETFAHGR